MTDKIVILSTCATQEEAEKLARVLLDARLAACVNVIPRIRSYYRWKGAIESADECLLVVKSSRDLIGSIGAVLEKEHSYEVPELLALPVVEGATNYLNWLLANLRSGSERRIMCDSIQSDLSFRLETGTRVNRVCITFGYLPDMELSIDNFWGGDPELWLLAH